MKTVNYLFAFGCMLILASAGRPAPKVEQPEKLLNIRLSGSHHYDHEFTLSDMAADVQYVALETTNDCLLGDVSGAVITKDYIFIRDKGIVFQLSRSGKFIRRMNRPGQGPKNCSARNFCIDEQSQLLDAGDID